MNFENLIVEKGRVKKETGKNGGIEDEHNQRHL